MKQFIRKNIYKWHNIMGLITVVPVMFWCLSGLMHPFMAHWFKPQISKEFVIPKPLKREDIKLTLQEVLAKNNIQEFKTFRLVEFHNNTYYQVKNKEDKWLYFNTQTGEALIEGDKKYAEFLARYFLGDTTSTVKSIAEVTEFSQQYKYINRLLPVWKISFDRPDKMDIYVETPYSRLGTFNPTSRKIFLWIFDNFHNWAFIGNISNNTFRIMVIIAFLSIIIISAVSGIIIYGFMWNNFKKTNSENKRGILRKYHRQIGLMVAIVTIAFAFSGAYHATKKLEPNLLPKMIYEPTFSLNDLNDSLIINQLDWKRVTNLSVIRTDNATTYYQAFYAKTDSQPAQVIYFHAKDGSVWQNGNIEYAIFLAHKFQQNCFDFNTNCSDKYSASNLKVLKTELLTEFEKREYGFAFKRLPVIKVSFDTPQKTNYYIETATSRLSAKVENKDRYEGYSFAILHKYLLMDWAGKNIRDIVMMFSAFGVLTVSILGFLLFINKRRLR